MTKEKNNKVDEKVEELKQAVEESYKPEGITQPVTVKLHHPNPNAVIFYTTDGTYPVPNKVRQYSKPFQVYQDTTVKAVAVVGEDVSPVFTEEYKVY